MIESSDKKFIILAAGGTGGHIFPAEALAEEFLSFGHRVMLVTDSRFANFKTGALSQVETKTINTGSASGGIMKKISGVFGIIRGISQAYFMLKKLNPDLVIGFGGYPSFPTVFAAIKAGIPTFIHEQNSVLGRANRLLAGGVDYIATSFPDTMMIEEKDKNKVVLVGNPVRNSVKILRNIPYSDPALDGKFNILVTGGSQGATIFSDVVPASIALLPENLRSRIRIDQQCRKDDVEKTKEYYNNIGVSADIDSFFVDLPKRLAWAHLVVARSGSSTVFELAEVGRPAILVPLPTSMDNHQYYNANAFEEAGGGWLMNQDGFTAESLAARLEAFLMAPDALIKAAAGAKKLRTRDAAEGCVKLALALAESKKGTVV